MAWRCVTPTLSTSHHRLDWPEYIPLFKQYRSLSLVSTSNAQRRPLAWASWQQTIYPGAPCDLYRFNPRPGKYLAFLGSLSLDQGLGRASELAKRAQLPLRFASRLGSSERLPLSIPTELIPNQGVEWLGELREEEVDDFSGEASLSSAPNSWPDPSGRFVAEALACGTPVVAFHGGVAAEMIYDHVTGFACESLDEMVDVLPLIANLDRRECRAAFEKRFSAERMTDRYLQLYERLISAARPPRLSNDLSLQVV